MDTTLKTESRNTGIAIRRGLRVRCPNCGQGRVLHSYLKVNKTCEVCGLDLSRARADDGPAYFTVLFVGHAVGVALHVMWSIWAPSPLVMAATISLGAIALSLWLLPRIKGAVIGFQWAKGVHGL